MLRSLHFILDFENQKLITLYVHTVNVNFKDSVCLQSSSSEFICSKHSLIPKRVRDELTICVTYDDLLFLLQDLLVEYTSGKIFILSVFVKTIWGIRDIPKSIDCPLLSDGHFLKYLEHKFSNWKQCTRMFFVKLYLYRMFKSLKECVSSNYSLECN